MSYNWMSVQLVDSMFKGYFNMWCIERGSILFVEYVAAKSGFMPQKCLPQVMHADSRQYLLTGATVSRADVMRQVPGCQPHIQSCSVMDL